MCEYYPIKMVSFLLSTQGVCTSLQFVRAGEFLENMSDLLYMQPVIALRATLLESFFMPLSAIGLKQMACVCFVSKIQNPVDGPF